MFGVIIYCIHFWSFAVAQPEEISQQFLSNAACLEYICHQLVEAFNCLQMSLRTSRACCEVPSIQSVLRSTQYQTTLHSVASRASYEVPDDVAQRSIQSVLPSTQYQTRLHSVASRASYEVPYDVAKYQASRACCEVLSTRRRCTA